MNRPVSVLHATTEIAPWIKTGGLADVTAALPEALARQGTDTRTVVPGFPAILDALQEARSIYEAKGLFGTAHMRVLQGRLPGRSTAVYVIDAPSMYLRPGTPYAPPQGQDWGDNLLRFAMLGWVSAKLASGEIDDAWRPDVLHVHDWHPALAHAYLADAWPPVKTVLTIHNIDYTGRFQPHDFHRLNLPHWVAAGLGPLEFFGDLCLLKAGMLLAHKVTTVSRTYAAEIIAGKHGNGLDTVARSRADGITGIVNGVDYGTWDPRNDPLLPAHYHPDDLAGKAACKTALRARFDLESLPDRPIFVIVSRLNRQKGLDLAADAADAIVESGGQLIVIGSGENQLEWRFQMLRDRHPRHIGVYLGYSDPLAHLAIAGGDVLLMPSRHEPCGLTQLYAKRYGTLPIVQSNGGLADTVDERTGFLFDERFTTLAETARQAMRLFQDRKRWRAMMSAAMRSDHGWQRSAIEYQQLYDRLTVQR